MGKSGSRVVFVSSMAGPAWGGSEELWSQAAATLARRGHKVYAVLPNVANRPAHPRIADLQKSGVNVQWWPKPAFRKEFFQMIYQQLRARLKFPRRDSTIWFRKSLEEINSSLAVFSSGNNDFPTALIQHCRILKIPYVLISQATYEYNWPADARATEMRDYFQNAAAAFFVCRENLETTRLMAGLAGENFRIARNPFNVPYDIELPWPGETGVARFAFVGCLEPNTKGCDLVLRALANPVWKTRPVEMHFYGRGNSENGVRRMAELLGVAHCFFHGHVDDVTEIWRQNHLLVLPSRFEGLPLAIVEAMLCGRPCVVTDVAGNAELLEDNVSGFIAAGSTVKCVAEALKRAWQQREQWPQMGQAAAKAIRANFPSNPAAEFTEQLLKLVEVNRLSENSSAD